MRLPVESVLRELLAALAARGVAVLQAPPGAGKTTLVPLALLEAPWLEGSRILMLEPRRLAARAAARRMAALLGEEVGGRVGFRVRHETRVGPRTRIEVVTEGVLTRMLTDDPTLLGTGIVIFDEFHERSVHADLGLALALYTRALVREDLRILVMSATLEAGPVAMLLGGAQVVTAEGVTHPVETRYLPPRRGTRLETAAAAAVRQALVEHAGDVLVFLPGAAEIRRTAALLEGVAADVIQLHGNLPPDVQDRAIRPAAPGRRKVVLATSIAETSLTIEGVGVVVDSGWARVPHYSPRTGMTRLATVRVSLAAATQRQGRAGRLGPGVCYRLWGEAEEQGFRPRPSPEILEADLAPLALQLAAAGLADPGDLAWPDPPPSAAFSEARSLLGQLGALDADGRITPHGRDMARRALHPRLSHMVLRGRELGAAREACELAGLLTERDVLRREASVLDADIRHRLDLLRGTVERQGVDRDALRRARLEARACADGLRAGGGRDGPIPGPGVLLSFAYPDRIARRRPGGGARYLLRSGTGAVLGDPALAREEYLVAADVEGGPREARIACAAPLTLEELEEHHGPAVEQERWVGWDAASRSVAARVRERLGALVLREGPLPDPDPGQVAAELLKGIRETGIAGLPWPPAAAGIRARVAFLRRMDSSWPDLSDEALAESAAEWLGPYLAGLRRLDEVTRLDLGRLLLDRLGWERREELERLAPSHLQVPSGSRVPLDYSDPESPVLAVRLQEVFGLAETPRVAGGRVPVTLHLLSPAGRPMQVTRDLAGFWRTTYFDVRKDLRGRYPRHYWPDDPLQAEPTRRAKPRRRPGNPG